SRPLRLPGRRGVRWAAALTMSALVAPPAAGASSIDLSIGSSGAAVKQLQAKLGGAADGAFGPQTAAAVRAFQQSHGLPVTGLVGPLTRAALGTGGGESSASSSTSTSTPSTTSLGSSEVRAIQQRLGITADGIFGPQTKAAVASFQSAHGLPTSYGIGPKTLSALGVSGSTTADPAAPSGISTTSTTSSASGAGAQAVQAALSKVGASYSYG